MFQQSTMGSRGYTPDFSFTILSCCVRLESLNIERRYSCHAMLNFEPVAPPATGGISQINKSSLVVHMWSCTQLSHFIYSLPTICDHLTADHKIIERVLCYFTALCVEAVFLMKTIRYIRGKCIQTYFHHVSLS